MTSNDKRLGAIGLDIGGTKIAAGVVLWPSGEILCRTVVPTKPTRGGEAVLKDTLELATQLRDWAGQERIDVVGIGAGVAELVDCDGNVTTQLHHSLARRSRAAAIVGDRPRAR